MNFIVIPKRLLDAHLDFETDRTRTAEALWVSPESDFANSWRLDNTTFSTTHDINFSVSEDFLEKLDADIGSYEIRDVPKHGWCIFASDEDLTTVKMKHF